MRRLLQVLGLAMLSACFWASVAQADVLLDQSDQGSGDSILSDSYTDDPGSNQKVADDFTIPTGQTWSINAVSVYGSFDLFDIERNAAPEPPPSALFVTIYANDDGQPGEVLFSGEQASPATGDGSGNYTIPLTGVPTLVAGTYWLSVQQSGATDGTTISRWKWALRSVSSGSPALLGGNQQCPQWSPITCGQEAPRSGILPSATPRIAAGVDTKMGIAGTRTGGALPPKCASTVGSGADNFHPLIPKKQTVLGVRTVLSVSETSDLDVDATLDVDGKKVALGSYSFANVTGSTKLRIPLPEPLRHQLHRGKHVTLLLKVTTRPKSASSCGGTVKNLTLKTRVINVRANLLK